MPWTTSEGEKNVLDVKALLDEMKASPYEEIAVNAPHTGVVTFAVTEEGQWAEGPGKEPVSEPGSVVAHLERERNNKPIFAPQRGQIVHIANELEGRFVEAGTPLLTIRHFLTKQEVLDRILQKALFLFIAPERAMYYFVPEVDSKIRTKGSRSVRVHDGDEIFILSRMKRETSLAYTGPEGIIYTVYFQPNKNVDEGEPLIGVCPEDQLDAIQDVVNRVQSEWQEQE